MYVLSCLTLCYFIDYNCQAPLFMEFPRQEYWSGLWFPSPGDLPDLGIEPPSLASPAFAGRFFTVWAIREAQTTTCVCVRVCESLSCVQLCDPMDCSLPGSSVHGILQAKILKWVVISFSRGSFQLRDRTQVSGIAVRLFTIWATRESL